MKYEAQHNIFHAKIYLKMSAKWQPYCHGLNRATDQEIICLIDLLHKCHNALVPYLTMHHFVTEMYLCAHFCYKMVHCGRFWQSHCGIYEMCLFKASCHFLHCLKKNTLQKDLECFHSDTNIFLSSFEHGDLLLFEISAAENWHYYLWAKCTQHWHEHKTHTICNLKIQ